MVIIIMFHSFVLLSSIPLYGYDLSIDTFIYSPIDGHLGQSQFGAVPGEGDGSPLQYSCLEKPMDGGAQWAAVHGVSKSRTRLNDFTFAFHFHALEKEMATTPVFLPGESQGLGSLVGCRLWGHTESDTTEATQQQQQQKFAAVTNKTAMNVCEYDFLQSNFHFSWVNIWEWNDWSLLCYVYI